MKPLSIFIGIILFSFSACQSYRLNKADRKMKSGEYYEASLLFKKIYAKASPHKRTFRSSIAYKLGDCYRLVNRTQQAIHAYRQALKHNTSDSCLLLYLAQMYQKNGQYKDAINYYDRYLLSDTCSQLAKNGITGSKKAPDWLQYPTRHIVNKISKTDSIPQTGYATSLSDEKYMYFSTDTLKGYGGKDLFRVHITGNHIGTIENLGPTINTEGNETEPYICRDGTLYFSSNGHPGLGGLDIFKAAPTSSGEWLIENLKFPMNSSGDDFNILFTEKGEKAGFFNSNRNNKRGQTDTYSFKLSPINMYIEGIVKDINEIPIDNATIRIVGEDGLNKKIKTEKAGHFRTRLTHNTEYIMMASASGHLNQSFALKTGPEEESETYIVDFYLSPVDNPIVIENIFYDFNQAVFRSDSKKALNKILKLLNDNPDISIEIGAHTDEKGTKQYNEQLSQDRALAVANYLTTAGINSKRLKTKGYGKNKPVIINSKTAYKFKFLKEGDTLTNTFIKRLTQKEQELANQINRRTEIKIIKNDSGSL